MGRASNVGYVTPLKNDGTPATAAGRGKFTLEATTTYYFPLGGADAAVVSGHLAWTDSAIVLTSVTVEDSNFPHADVTDYSEKIGEWIDEDPTTAFVGVVGTNVTQSNGVVAATGDSAGGGCLFHIADSGARRTRLKVVVGATGGTVRCAVHGKD